jgi:FlaA1/EpsC-like NDP-sugar epimerase
MARLVRLLPVLLLDALLVAASYAAALALKFDGDIPRESVVFYGQVIVPIALAYIAGNYFFGVYRTEWKYASIADAISLASAVGLVSILVIGINALLSPRYIPLTVTATAPALIFLSMSVAKLWPRLRAQAPFATWGGPMQRVLIAGAGRTGQMLAREFVAHGEWGYRPIGFVDDDTRKHGTRIHGLPVLGGRYDVPHLVEQEQIDVVALAIPSSTGVATREFVGICQEADVAVRMVPGVPEIVNPASAGKLREITVDDLLGGERTEIDTEACARALGNQEILITGAAGYLGQELARQLLQFNPKALHLLDTNETGLYDLQRDLAAEGRNVRIWMTDITDAAQVDRVFRKARPDVVFHTAAYKHIPVIEEQPAAAFHVNVRGTLNLCRAAAEFGVKRFIFVSTNKAADLDSAYGATKRIGELLVGSLAGQSITTFTAVRLHNVMGSRGSVVPLFLRQIEQGGPVLLTHADISRYFMSPPETVRLLIQAGATAESGQVCVVDLGEEVKIGDLAEKLIRLRGYQPGRDIQVLYTGLRPGEQVRETPLHERGTFLPTAHPKVFLATGGIPCSAEEIMGRIEALQLDLPEGRDELVARLHALARIDLRDTQPVHAQTET